MIVSKTVTITDSPTIIHRSSSNGCYVYLAMPKNGDTVTLGSSAITYGVGLSLESKTDGSNHLNVMLPSADSLYGICSTGNSEAIGVLIIEY